MREYLRQAIEGQSLTKVGGGGEKIRMKIEKKLTMSCFKNRLGDRMYVGEAETVTFCRKAARRAIASAMEAEDALSSAEEAIFRRATSSRIKRGPKNGDGEIRFGPLPLQYPRGDLMSRVKRRPAGRLTEG